MNHPVGKQSGAGKQEHGRKSHVLFDFHFVEDVKVERDQRKVKENRQHSVGVIVQVPVLAGAHTNTATSSKVARSQIAYPNELGTIAFRVPVSLFQMSELFIGHLVAAELALHR